METKTHIDKLRNPNYLGGWDFIDDHGKKIDKTVTIKAVKSELVFSHKNQENEPALTVYFEECKPIILNSTNRKTLKIVTKTSYVEEMAGKKIQLTTKKIKAFGEMHDAIRIVNIIPAIAVDDSKAIAELTKATTLDELKSMWMSLSTEEKNNNKVIAFKEEHKKKLS